MPKKNSNDKKRSNKSFTQYHQRASLRVQIMRTSTLMEREKLRNKLHVLR
jgi:hypothetical protein